MHVNKPAFPGIRVDEDTGNQVNEPGMTLRDYWATEFLPMVVANNGDTGTGFKEGWLGACKLAYKIADAMAEARDYNK